MLKPMINGPISRREFLKISLVAGSSLALCEGANARLLPTFCISGFGSFGKAIYGELTTLGSRCVAVADPDTRSTSDFPNLIRYACLDDLLLKERPSAVVIATPDARHGKETALALRHKAHVLIAAPAARERADLEEIRQYASTSNRVVRTTSPARLFPELKRLTRVIQTGEVGEIQKVLLRVRTPGPHPKGNDWRTDSALANGNGICLMEAMLHHFFISSRVDSWQVYAAGVRPFFGSREGTAEQLTGCFRIGPITIDLELQSLGPGCPPRAELVYHCTEGTVCVDWFRGWTIFGNKQGDIVASEAFAAEDGDRRLARLAWIDLSQAAFEGPAECLDEMITSEAILDLATALRTGMPQTRHTARLS